MKNPTQAKKKLFVISVDRNWKTNGWNIAPDFFVIGDAGTLKGHSKVWDSFSYMKAI